MRPAVPVVATGGITDGRQVSQGLGLRVLPCPALPWLSMQALCWFKVQQSCWLPSWAAKVPRLAGCLAGLGWHSGAGGGMPAHGYCALALWTPRCCQRFAASDPAVGRQQNALCACSIPCILEAHSPAAVQIAAALIMGADGVAIGTRLNCTPESTYPEHKKKALLGAGVPCAHQQSNLT